MYIIKIKKHRRQNSTWKHTFIKNGNEVDESVFYKDFKRKKAISRQIFHEEWVEDGWYREEWIVEVTIHEPAVENVTCYLYCETRSGDNDTGSYGGYHNGHLKEPHWRLYQERPQKINHPMICVVERKARVVRSDLNNPKYYEEPGEFTYEYEFLDDGEVNVELVEQLAIGTKNGQPHKLGTHLQVCLSLGRKETATLDSGIFNYTFIEADPPSSAVLAVIDMRVDNVSHTRRAANTLTSLQAQKQQLQHQLRTYQKKVFPFWKNYKKLRVKGFRRGVAKRKTIVARGAHAAVLQKRITGLDKCIQCLVKNLELAQKNKEVIEQVFWGQFDHLPRVEEDLFPTDDHTTKVQDIAQIYGKFLTISSVRDTLRRG